MNLKLESKQHILLDTSVISSYWGADERYFAKLNNFFDQIYTLDIQMIIPVVTYADLLAYQLANTSTKTAAKLRSYMSNSKNVMVYPIDIIIAERAARHQSKFDIDTITALKFATADISGADIVVTSNSKWHNLPNISVFMLDEL